MCSIQHSFCCLSFKVLSKNPPPSYLETFHLSEINGVLRMVELMACTKACGLSWLSCLQIHLILLVRGACPLWKPDDCVVSASCLCLFCLFGVHRSLLLSAPASLSGGITAGLVNSPRTSCDFTPQQATVNPQTP